MLVTRLRRSVVGALFLACSGAALAQDPLQGVPRVLPPVPQVISPEADAFVATLRDRVGARDYRYIRSLVDRDTLLSFGGNGGLEEFEATYAERQGELFQILDHLMLLGGRTTSDKSAVLEYCTPYTFLDFPRELDAYSHGVVIDEGVPLRRSQMDRPGSMIELSYHVVKLLPGAAPEGYQRVGACDILWPVIDLDRDDYS